MANIDKLRAQVAAVVREFLAEEGLAPGQRQRTIQTRRGPVEVTEERCCPACRRASAEDHCPQSPETFADPGRMAQWLWSGQADLSIAALVERQQELGVPARDEREASPRVQAAKRWANCATNDTAYGTTSIAAGACRSPAST